MSRCPARGAWRRPGPGLHVWCTPHPGRGSGPRRLTELRVTLSSLPAWPRPGPPVFLPPVPTRKREERRPGFSRRPVSGEARPPRRRRELGTLVPPWGLWRSICKRQRCRSGCRAGTRGGPRLGNPALLPGEPRWWLSRPSLDAPGFTATTRSYILPTCYFPLCEATPILIL